ncbi:Crp/Fnr family transcriptional regulator [Flavobacterium selenitireducens]|uniref:Crp/Fnr family transcriptional regulator n=1 Tax=Flavobacterium selenitireducens TaxID=2722704 RepID=UPI00168AAA54|nr:Crp/Fnr family transcriptional regulator [Flavobacterium selenitireducens]MBD3581913.1 Crp/Fnr family transcriptional regulator [Flavobacterium selenitireducens]
MELRAILNALCHLPTESSAKLEKIATEMSWPKGKILIRADNVEENLYLIKRGIVRAYAVSDSAETTFWFGSEGDIVISMKSYVDNQKGYEDIEPLEDCELYALNVSELQDLYARDIHIANWGRKFAESELIKTEERLISRQFKSATQRYQDLLGNHPDLIKRVQLGHIASYLGITQVSLSRIRAQVIR